MNTPLQDLLAVCREVENRLRDEEHYIPNEGRQRGTTAEYLLLKMQRARKAGFTRTSALNTA